MSKKSIYDKFKSDRKTEQEGVILDYGDDQWIRIARAGGSNKKFEAALQALHRKYGTQMELKLLDSDRNRALMIEVYADTIVLSWGGFTDEDGNELAFTRENIIKVFTDLPELFNDVFRQSSNFQLFKQEILKVEEGN